MSIDFPIIPRQKQIDKKKIKTYQQKKSPRGKQRYVWHSMLAN